jgi:hypothetical protein
MVNVIGSNTEGLLSNLSLKSENMTVYGGFAQSLKEYFKVV